MNKTSFYHSKYCHPLLCIKNDGIQYGSIQNKATSADSKAFIIRNDGYHEPAKIISILAIQIGNEIPHIYLFVYKICCDSNLLLFFWDPQLLFLPSSYFMQLSDAWPTSVHQHSGFTQLMLINLVNLKSYQSYKLIVYWQQFLFNHIFWTVICRCMFHLIIYVYIVIFNIWLLIIQIMTICRFLYFDHIPTHHPKQKQEWLILLCHALYSFS